MTADQGSRHCLNVDLEATLSAAGVGSITALGSSGSYAYLTTEKRARVAHLAVEHAGGPR